MTGFAVRVLDPRADPEPADWPAFVARVRLHPVWDYGLLRLESWMARNPPVLAVVRDGEVMVAAVSVMVCRPWREPRYAPGPAARTARARPRWAEAYLPWLGGHPAYAFDSGLDAEGRRAALRAAERELARYLGIGFLGVVYRVVDRHTLAAVTGPGRMVRSTLPTAVLENRWSTVDGWLATLGPERRKSIRRYARKIEADPGIVVDAGPGRDDLDPHQLAALLRDHRTRLGLPRFDTRTHVAGAYLDAYLRRPEVRTLTYRDSAGTLLAVNTLIDHPVRAVLQHWAAVPVSAGGRYNLYFDAYLRAVRHVIDTGRPELSAGRGLQDVKSSLGFAPRDLWSIIVPRPVIGR